MIQINERVYPSAGHHDKDSGAVANGYVEAEEMKLLRNMIAEKLKAKNHHFSTDKDWENNRQYQNRIRKTLRTGDVVLDMHLNAASPSATGIEIFISNNAGKDSIAMANETLEGLVKITGMKSRGVRRERLTQHKRIGILNLKGTAILIEFGFITNTSDMEKFVNNREEIADFLEEMLIKYDRNH